MFSYPKAYTQLRFSDAFADYEGRSVNRHVLVLIRENIKAFEEANGVIEGNINPDVSVKPTRKQ